MRTQSVFMKLVLLGLVLIAIAADAALTAQNAKSTAEEPKGNATKTQSTKSEPAKAEESKAESSKDAVDKVLRRMDQRAANFHTAQADLVWTTYNSVAEQNLTDKGKIYFHRSGKDIEMAVELQPPSARQIIFANGKAQV